MQKIDFEHFAQMVEQTSDAILSTDAHLTIKTWNAAAEELYGFSREEVTGQKLGSLLKSRLNASKLSKELTELRKKGFFQGEYEYIHKNGNVRYIQASVTVLRDQDRCITGYVAIHRDIDEQKKREEQLTRTSVALQEQVKEKTAQITGIFESITDAFVALDNNCCYTYMNKKAGELFNCVPADMIGKHIWTEFPEGINQPFYHAYQRAMRDQQYVHLEEYYPPYNRWFENNIYPSPDGLSIFFRDVTHNKQMEEQAKLSNQRLLLHLTNSPLGAVEWDSNYVITSWSQQAETVFGWSKNEAVGKTIEQLNLVYEEDGEHVYSVIDELIGGQISRSKTVNRNNKKNGEVIYCEWYNSVLKDDSGSIVSCMSLVQDITEKRIAEEALAFSEQQLNLIYNSSSDILYLLSCAKDEKYRFISVNNAFKKATGLTSDQIIGKPVEEVIPHPSSQLVLARYKEALQTRKTVHWEEVTEYPAGIKTGLVSITPVFDKQGECTRLVGSVHDITANKKAEVKLLEKNEQLRNLSAHLQDIREEERANIAREIHDELGERLTAIRLDISWIENHLSSATEPVKDKFPALTQLVDDTIKTVRKISTELRPSILDDFGLVDALEWQAIEFEKRTGISCKVKSFMKQHIANKKIEITLFRIFQESLTNISRHAAAKKVVAQLLMQENMIELSITDDGVGMNLNSVQNKKTLGLMGMKERVLMVNGTYNITSGIGSGTTITVSIPNV
ncbi:MAG TPA: PAS domain S-box protein [Segetibacter sp.]|nr:PAS domain S-box protein [Segetibacter sp.]